LPPAWPYWKQERTLPESFQRNKGVCSTTMTNVGRESSVGLATRYGLDGPGIKSRRSQWPSGLRRGSAVARLLGSRVRMPMGAWMFVL
jgi:hypothetical protein